MRVLLIPSVLFYASVWAVPPHEPMSRTVAGKFPTSISIVALGDTGDTLAPSLATITTDTGAFAPGHRDFTRYTAIGLCLAAARMARIPFKRSLEAQLLRDSLRDDTIGVGGSLPVVQSCAARFTLATTPVADLGDLFALAVVEHNDTLAHAVLARLLQQRRDRDSVYVDGVQTYLDYGWRSAATALVAQVDVANSVSYQTRLQLHLALLPSQAINLDADTTGRRAESEAILRLLDGTPSHGDLASYEAEVRVYQGLFRLILFEHSDSLPDLAHRFVNAMRKYGESPAVTQSPDWRPWDTWSTEQVSEYLAPEWWKRERHIGSVAAPRLQAAVWFPAPGMSPSDTVVPIPGKVNLICQEGWPGTSGSNDVHFSKDEFMMASQIRRWLAEYGPDKLAVTLVWPAAGYTELYGQGEKWWGWFQTPTEEAELWHWYTQDYLQLPVTVVIQDIHSVWLPAPDGRRLAETKMQVDTFWQHAPEMISLLAHWDSAAGDDSINGPRPAEGPGKCVIIDGHGMIRDLSAENEGIWSDEWIPWDLDDLLGRGR